MKTATGKRCNMKGVHDAKVWMLQHLDAPSVEGLNDYLISDQELAKKFNIPVVSIGGIRRRFDIPNISKRMQIANEFQRLNRTPSPDPDTTVGRKSGEDINVPTNVPTKLPAWCKIGQWVKDDIGEIRCITSVGKNNICAKLDNSISSGPYTFFVPIKFRPYSYEEAKGLLGKTMEYFTGRNGEYRHIVTINDVGESKEITDGGESKDCCLVNWYSHSYWIEAKATIDGMPFGFPEVDQEALKGGEA